jgi:protein SCO1/2
MYYNKVPGSNSKNYTMDHTAGSYVFDPSGNLRLYIKHGQGAQPIAHDLKVLLQ